jgi:hypothetical protein
MLKKDSLGKIPDKASTADKGIRRKERKEKNRSGRSLLT